MGRVCSARSVGGTRVSVGKPEEINRLGYLRKTCMGETVQEDTD